MQHIAEARPRRMVNKPAPLVEVAKSLRLGGLRVLVLFGGSELFGQERANIEVFRSLSTLGLKARFVTSSKWGHRQIQPGLERQGFEWTTAPFGYHWTRHVIGRHFRFFLLNLYGLVATSWRVWREVRRWKPTHLYVVNWAYFVYAAPAILSIPQPLIFRAGDQLPYQNCFQRWIGRMLMKSVACLVWNCEFLQRRFMESGLRANKTRVIYNYPPTSATKTPLNLPTTPPDSVVLLYVGQISEHKGVQVLVETAQRLLRQGSNLTLWIVGESTWGNDLTSRLQDEIKVDGWSERIYFLGYRTEVAELLRRADVHVCPSVWDEPSPNVVLEAKREGVPSVVFPIGGVPELVEHQVDGYVCRACTAGALREGISFFLNNPEKRREAGAAARRSLDDKFGWERFRRQWAEVFESTAGARQTEQ